LIFLALLLLVVFLRLPFVGQPFENDSGAIAYNARLISRGEPLYSTHHPTHHMPGVYYTYAAAFTLFGDQVQSVKALLILWSAITVYLIYRLGAIAAHRWVGLAAAVMAAVLYTHPLISGTTSKRDNFIGLPQTAAILLLFTFIKKRSKPWLFLWVGLFIGIAFMFKVNYIFSPLAITGLALLVEFWSNREWRTLLLRGAWVAIGFAVVLLPVVLYLAAQGLVSRWLLAFELGFGYTQVGGRTDLASPIYLVLYPFALLIRANPVLVISALAGLVILIWALLRWKRREPVDNLIFMGYIGLWFLLCFVETGFSRTYLHNYYLIFVPSLTLLAAWFWYRLVQDNWQRASQPARRAIVVLLGIILLAILVLGLRDNRAYYSHFYLRYLSGQESYDDVLLAGMPEGVGASMGALSEIAAYIDAHTEPDDTIYYWSNLMQLYYMANRRSAKDIIWPLYIDATGPPEEVFTATYFVLGQDMPLGFTEQPAWLSEGLEDHYQLETTLYGQALYRRLAEEQ